MDFCGVCGILLFQHKGKQLCSACQIAKEDIKKLIRNPSCDCDYCNRNFDWVEPKYDSLVSTPSPTIPVSRISAKESQVDDNLRAQWEKEQLWLKQKLLVEDSDVIKNMRQKIEKGTLKRNEAFYIGGVDISFIKGDNVNACAAFVVVSYPALEVVYEDYEMVALTAPYIPGFLAFREVEFLVNLYRKLERTKPQFLPQVIMVDGNGILHPRGFGLASQLGVLLDVACIGVAKTLIHVDGLENDDTHRDKKSQLTKGGDKFLLQTSSGHVLGMALRSCDNTTNPIYVSIGHMISLETAVWLVYKCCKYRIPEPTRKADLNSRDYLRVNHPEGYKA